MKKAPDYRIDGSFAADRTPNETPEELADRLDISLWEACALLGIGAPARNGHHGAPGKNSIHRAYDTRVFDRDDARARATLGLAQTLRSDLGLGDGLDIRIDDTAARRTQAESTTGVYDRGVVYLDPHSYRPDDASGRRLLAHEMTHAAQHQIVGLGITIPGAAEAEADHVGQLFARGGRIQRPVEPLGAGLARDEGKGLADHIRARLQQPPDVDIDVKHNGLLVRPPAKLRWQAGASKSLQLVAMVVHKLVGAQYSAQLAADAHRHLVTQRRLRAFGGAVGNARQQEVMRRQHVDLSTSTTLVSWLRDTRKLQLSLSDEQLAILERGVAASGLWHDRLASKHQLPAWYPRSLFEARVLSIQTAPLLPAYRAAARAYRGSKSKTTAANLTRAVDAVLAHLEADATLLDGIREDVTLTSHGVLSQLMAFACR